MFSINTTSLSPTDIIRHQTLELHGDDWIIALAEIYKQLKVIELQKLTDKMEAVHLLHLEYHKNPSLVQ
ncbi:MAG: hypothetical protein AAF806_18890 [Bacteroidota bacterium]